MSFGKDALNSNLREDQQVVNLSKARDMQIDVTTAFPPKKCTKLFQIAALELTLFVKVAAEVKIVFYTFPWHLWLRRTRSQLKSILFWGKFLVRRGAHSNSLFQRS